MTRPMDHLAEQINLYQRGRLSRRQLLERGAALGLSAAGLAALGAVSPVAGQERFVRARAPEQIRKPSRQLVGRQPNHARADDGAALLQAEEELRGLQHRLQNQPERAVEVVAMRLGKP